MPIYKILTRVFLYLQHALDVRTMLIRYLSTSVLEPIGRLYEDLKQLAEEEELDGFDWRRLQTITRMKNDCNKSMTVLNDLMTFDKLENGIVAPQFKFKNAWSFLRDTMRPYQLMVHSLIMHILIFTH